MATTKELILNRVMEAMEANSELFSAEAKKVIIEAFNSKKQVKKIDNEGRVYCNYFNKYLDKSLFNVDKNGKYKSLSKIGVKYRNREKVLKEKLNKELANLLFDDKIKDIDKTKEKLLKDYNTQLEQLRKEAENELK